MPGLLKLIPWPPSHIIAKASSIKWDMVGQNFDQKQSIAAQYGWRTDAWYIVKQPNTPRALAKMIWKQRRQSYALIQPYLRTLDKYEADYAAPTKRAWGKYGAIIDLAVAGFSDMLSSTETHNFWTALGFLGIEINGVQGLSSNWEDAKSALKDCSGLSGAAMYKDCLVQAGQDVGRLIPKEFLNALASLGSMLSMLKWGSIAFAGFWAYGQLKGSRR